MRYQKTKSSILTEGVKHMLEKYGDYIKSDKHLVLLYWQQIDGVEMDKQSISTTDFLNMATSESDIIATKSLLDITKGSDHK